MTKETREFENKERTARKSLENLRTRSEMLERDSRVSEQEASRSKKTGEFENREQTARKRLENWRSKLLERD